MSIKYVLPEIERFLTQAAASVLVISGRWGVGKTYAWKRFLSVAKDGGKVTASHYAYVSLFGINSLDELKAAIFQNTVAHGDIGKDADLDTLETVLEQSPGLWRKGGVIGRLIPGLEKYFANFEKVGFFWIKRQVICIDDLERKSKNLELRTILGLISHLKEQRQCKIVLLLNDEKLADGDDAEFRAQLEKVADTNLKFAPTSAESVDIALDGTKPFHAELGARCRELRIVNIRTIKKLEDITQRLQDELSGFDNRVLDQAIQTLALFGYCKWQPDDAPPLEIAMDPDGLGTNFDDAFAAAEAGADVDPKRVEWRAFLSTYGFGGMDEFDSAILKIVVDGHFDAALLRGEAQRLQERYKARDGDKSFEDAWELYHGSFDDDADEVMNALVAAVKSVPKGISPTNLSGTVSLLKDLQWNGNVAELIDAYIEGNKEKPPEFWDLDESAFGENVRDPDVRKAFMTKLMSFSDDRDPQKLLVEIGRTSSWDSAEVTFLAGLSKDEFKGIFKGVKGKDLRKAVKGAMIFKGGEPDTPTAVIYERATEALREIAAESDINKRRVTQKGVNLTPPEDEE